MGMGEAAVHEPQLSLLDLLSQQQPTSGPRPPSHCASLTPLVSQGAELPTSSRQPATDLPQSVTSHPQRGQSGMTVRCTYNTLQSSKS